MNFKKIPKETEKSISECQNFQRFDCTYTLLSTFLPAIGVRVGLNKLI